MRFDEGGVIIDLLKEPRIEEIDINEDIVKNTVSKVPLLRVLNPDREETRDKPVPTEIEEAKESSPNYKAPSVKDSDEEEEVSFHDTEATPFGLGDQFKNLYDHPADEIVEDVLEFIEASIPVSGPGSRPRKQYQFVPRNTRQQAAINSAVSSITTGSAQYSTNQDRRFLYSRELHAFRANFKAARVKGDDPQSIDKALSRSDKHKWIAAIQAEYSALGRKKT